MVGRKSLSSRIGDTIITVILVLSAILCVAPIINVFAISLSNGVAVEAGKVTFFPVDFSLESYKQIMEDVKFARSFGIAVLRVIVGCAVNMFFMIIMAFPLSRNTYQFKSRNKYMYFLIFTMMFNGGMIPTYMLINKLGLIDSFWSMILPGAIPTFNIILLMNFFRGIPHELEEAAIIDGASPGVILLKLFIPLAKPAIATVLLFTMLGHWNSFFDAILYLNKTDNYPLQAYIFQLTNSVDMNQMALMTPEQIEKMMKISNQTFNSAKVFVSMIPILCVYPFAQKYFTKGIVLGSVKG